MVYSSALKVSILLCYPRGLNPLSLGSCNITLWPCYIAMVMEIFLIFNHIIEPALLFFFIFLIVFYRIYTPRALLRLQTLVVAVIMLTYSAPR